MWSLISCKKWTLIKWEKLHRIFNKLLVKTVLWMKKEEILWIFQIKAVERMILYEFIYYIYYIIYINEGFWGFGVLVFKIWMMLFI